VTDSKYFSVSHIHLCKILPGDSRRLILTDQGYVGHGPDAIEPGDTVFVILGRPVLMVLLPVEEHWEVWGEGSVYGIV
jgi:hypothetical protein